jgi:hypothetical protein
MRFGTIARIGGMAAAAALIWIRPWRTKVAPSTLLDDVLPAYQFRDTIAITIDSSPERILAAFRGVTLRDMPIAWLMGALRYLPQSLLGNAPDAGPDQPFFAMLRCSTCAIALAERPGEVALGIIGRLHQLADQDPQQLSGARAFRAFDRPGFEKLALSVRVLPHDDTNVVVVEHRIQALGRSARLRFGLYWLVIKPMGAFVTYQMLRAVRRIACEPLPEFTEPSEHAEAPGMAEMIDELEATFA